MQSYRGVLKKAFIKISQNSQENTRNRVSFLTSLKIRLWHICFPVNLGKNFIDYPGGCFFLSQNAKRRHR